jgi:hypothetical protein
MQLHSFATHALGKARERPVDSWTEDRNVHAVGPLAVALFFKRESPHPRMPPESLYHELMFYTLAHPSPAFLHQHAVDAYTAQHADATTKPIAITFALIGLYLLVERGFTGRQVQIAHMQMAKRRKPWLSPALPDARGDILVSDVLAAPPGPARDAAIDAWSRSVWRAFQAAHSQIAALALSELGV